VKLFVVALHENVEERPFLGRRIFDSLMWNLRPGALSLGSAALLMASGFNASPWWSNFKDTAKWQLPTIFWIGNFV
jgi:hypothetical protein